MPPEMCERIVQRAAPAYPSQHVPAVLEALTQARQLFLYAGKKAIVQVESARS